MSTTMMMMSISRTFVSTIEAITNMMSDIDLNADTMDVDFDIYMGLAVPMNNSNNSNNSAQGFQEEPALTDNDDMSICMEMDDETGNDIEDKDSEDARITFDMDTDVDMEDVEDTCNIRMSAPTMAAPADVSLRLSKKRACAYNDEYLPLSKRGAYANDTDVDMDGAEDTCNIHMSTPTMAAPATVSSRLSKKRACAYDDSLPALKRSSRACQHISFMPMRQ